MGIPRVFGAVFLLCAAAASAAAFDKEALARSLTDCLRTGEALSLGWSRDGLTAVVVPLDGGERGASGFRFLLLDAVEDKLVTQAEVWSDEFDPPPVDWASAAAASDNLRAFEAAFDEHKLVAGELLLAPFPVITKAGNFSARADVKTIAADGEHQSKTLDYSIVVTSPQGQKTVTSSRVSSAYSVSIAGFFLSPLEARMLVVYQVEKEGFEGGSDTELRFAGCKLNLGFVKK